MGHNVDAVAEVVLECALGAVGDGPLAPVEGDEPGDDILGYRRMLRCIGSDTRQQLQERSELVAGEVLRVVLGQLPLIPARAAVAEVGQEQPSLVRGYPVLGSESVVDPGSFARMTRREA